ncbi:MAG: hypothetical protein AAF560_17680 [Acidobacteriota bacterium]
MIVPDLKSPSPKACSPLQARRHPERPSASWLAPGLAWAPTALIMTALILTALVIVVLLPAPLAAQPATPQAEATVSDRLPELRFESVPALARQVAALEQFDRQPLLDAMHLLGLQEGGLPIRVVVAQEGSVEARRAPSWAVAYAISGAGLVVLIPSRVPGYPDNSLETVLIHEIAHVLIGRAAGHRPIPRWFNEGLAIHAAREWSFEDRARVAFATVRRDGVSLAEIERRFRAGSHSAQSAYALSAAFMRFLRDRYGYFVAANILDHVALGLPFPQAFERATGTTLAAAELRFWSHLDLWNKWVPFLTSSATLWMLIMMLALWAFRRRQQRDAEQLAAWEAEEQRQLERATTTPWVN